MSVQIADIVNERLVHVAASHKACAKATSLLNQIEDALTALDFGFEDETVTQCLQTRSIDEIPAFLEAQLIRLRAVVERRSAEEAAAERQFEQWSNSQKDTAVERHNAELKVLHKRIADLEVQDDDVAYPDG